MLTIYDIRFKHIMFVVLYVQLIAYNDLRGKLGEGNEYERPQ